MNTQLKKLLIVLGIVAVLGGYFFQQKQTTHSSGLSDSLRSQMDGIPTEAGKNLFLKQSNNLTKPVDAELVDLDSQILTCDANIDGLLSASPHVGGSCLAGPTTLSSIQGKYLGGQCCGVLSDTTEYHEHLRKLKENYSNIADIPLDPYHTPIDMAKRWIDYDNNTTLTATEQKVYDQAMDMSKEKPCCCKCWHYFVNEGVGKKMIREYHLNPKQVADFWDISDICGV